MRVTRRCGTGLLAVAACRYICGIEIWLGGNRYDISHFLLDAHSRFGAK